MRPHGAHLNGVYFCGPSFLLGSVEPDRRTWLERPALCGRDGGGARTERRRGHAYCLCAIVCASAFVHSLFGSSRKRQLMSCMHAFASAVCFAVLLHAGVVFCRHRERYASRVSVALPLNACVDALACVGTMQARAKNKRKSDDSDLLAPCDPDELTHVAAHGVKCLSQLCVLHASTLRFPSRLCNEGARMHAYILCLCALGVIARTCACPSLKELMPLPGSGEPHYAGAQDSLLRKARALHARADMGRAVGCRVCRSLPRALEPVPEGVMCHCMNIVVRFLRNSVSRAWS